MSEGIVKYFHRVRLAIERLRFGNFTHLTCRQRSLRSKIFWGFTQYYDRICKFRKIRDKAVMIWDSIRLVSGRHTEDNNRTKQAYNEKESRWRPREFGT